MSKIFRTRCFIFDATGMRQTNATIEVDTTKQTVEFRASGYTVTTSIGKVKELISEYAVIGTTTMKEDKDNQTLIRYTKGIARTTSKGVTVSLSHVDETGNDVYMITADASEFDKYIRSKLYEKSRGLKDFRKEQELQNALFQYQLYEAVMNDMMKQAITAMIAVCEKRRYKKPYIQRFFNDIIMVLEMPEIFGQQMCSNEMMAEYAEKYDLDFDRINVKMETLDDYCKRYKIKR